MLYDCGPVMHGSHFLQSMLPLVAAAAPKPPIPLPSLDTENSESSTAPPPPPAKQAHAVLHCMKRFVSLTCDCVVSFTAGNT